jgi:DNA-binding beta-propeller fold protein YncE
LRALARAVVLSVTLVALIAGVQRGPNARLAVGQIGVAGWPYFPGSTLPLRITGFTGSYHAALVGPGELLPGGVYAAPRSIADPSALLIAGNSSGLAAARLRLSPPPKANQTLIFTASYDQGLIVHDGRDFSVLGVVGTGGAPSDTAIDSAGRVAVTDTQGSTLTVVTLAPWAVARIDGVPLGDETAIDPVTHAIFVSNRDANGSGALTRILPDGSVTHTSTGATAEGLAIDQRRHLVYVANANDGTIAAVDARTMRVAKRFPAVERVFSLALSPDGKRLYAISNQSAGSLFAAPGSAVLITLSGSQPHVTARSAPLNFPLGVALDARRRTLFVTEEGRNEIDVLDAATLHSKRPALKTCKTPWKPAFDTTSDRLYVPCAGDNAIDVFDANTLRRLPHAPFATGSYPLAVEIWNPAKA